MMKLTQNLSRPLVKNDDAVLEVLHTAVNLAKERQIRSVENLKMHLNLHYPSRAEDINSAIQLWAEYEQKKRS